MGVVSNPRTMKELLAYSELQKKSRADGHRRAVRADEYIYIYIYI